FAIAQTCVGHNQGALVGCPNPFYQIYEGAALLAGAQTVLFNTNEDSDFLPDPAAISDQDWDAMQLLYLCSPGNPTGAVMETGLLQRFIEKAHKHKVVLVSDECYSEIYPDESAPPTGLLAASAAMGISDYRHCISMHSLSKRSNLPGLRSGFAAGDASIIGEFLRYRGYHGSAMPPHHQVASTVAWGDERHVLNNRDRYREKFAAVRAILEPVLPLNNPGGGFYLWPRVPLDDETFTRRLYGEAGVLVLPGSYLGRDCGAGNPGAGRVRMALVAELADCVEAAERIAAFVRSLPGA
ncbi:MAG: aminotransferase class I/II-fold pyridoxal phosphate-dependent enzyme, partial [Congregibacter sp.]|nr:aminotransferase class I/II-fold pyridoxal phosphate-dependent enzyme [Congregibacter sp.]